MHVYKYFYVYFIIFAINCQQCKKKYFQNCITRNPVVFQTKILF